MSLQPGQNLYSQNGGIYPENVEIPVIANRAPTSSDWMYPIGKRWDYLNNAEYILLGLSTVAGITTATWALSTKSTGVVAELTTSDSVIVLPDANGNINTLGTGSITTVGTTNTTTVELTGLTNHAVLVGAGTATITKLTVGTDGQVLTGNSAADPAFAALGTGSGLTAHGVVIAEGASAFAATAAGTTGQGLVGSTGADPVWTDSPSYSGSVTAGTTLTATLGAITATNGNLVLGTAGNKIDIATGANASCGVSGAMTGTPGAIIVATTACTASSVILYSRATTGGTAGNVSITAQDGTGFTLTSDANETSTFNWLIIN